MFRQVSRRSFKSYSVLKPFVDVDARLSDVDALKENVRRRKLNVDVEEISSFRQNLKKLEMTKSQLEESREAVRQRLSKILSDDSDETQKLKMTAKIIREDLKHVRSTLMDLDQNLIHLMMKVPADLHPKTQDEDVIIHETAHADSGLSHSHLKIGSEMDLLEFKSPWAYFFKDQAALLEVKVPDALSKILKTRDFVGFSNPDFVRTIVVDGCEGSYTSAIPLEEFEGDADTTFLTGGASLLPFLAFFAKNSILDSDLPLRCYANGRQYAHEGTPKFGLYDSTQTNALQTFILTNLQSEENELQKMVKDLIHFYDSFSIPYRVSIKSADQLRVAESLRVSFDLFSPHFDRFFECGHVSLYGSHLSKIMNIHCTGDEMSFPHVISGTVVRTAPLMACILENKKTQCLDDLLAS